MSLEDHSHQTCQESLFVHSPLYPGLVSTHLINIALTYSIMIFPLKHSSTLILLGLSFTGFQCILSLNHFLHILTLASRTPYSPGWPCESCGFKKPSKEIEVTDSHLSNNQILSVLKVSSFTFMFPSGLFPCTVQSPFKAQFSPLCRIFANKQIPCLLLQLSS